ncbi:MAG: chromophore lyase [Prevotella sp.]|nr:chromophore lyase [Prevotella sp.]
MRISKTTLLCAIATLAFAVPGMAQMSEYDYNEPVGWGTVDGTITGSEDENPVTVTTLAGLKSALSGTGKKTIFIKDTIVFTGYITLSSVKNKTVYGLPGSALVNNTRYVGMKPSESGLFYCKNCSNLIFRNVTFKGSGAYDIEGYDNLDLRSCSYIWIDHCDFQDATDGCLEINHGSDNICVTWCRFRYLLEPLLEGYTGDSGGGEHRFPCLWGNGDSNGSEDSGHLNITCYSCWWDSGCMERMPRVRFGKVHLLNCLYTCTGNNYCIGTGYMSNIYADRCSFIGVKNCYKNYATISGYKDYNMTITGCYYTNISGNNAKDYQVCSGSNAYFVPSDYYTLDGYAVADVKEQVSTYAGPTLNVVEGKGVVVDAGIGQIISSDARTVGVNYYTPSGMKLSQPQRGMNIVVRKMSDGTIKTTKEIIK